jgi:predicted  nucleic acid-binding Zn-ribbon protein
MPLDKRRKMIAIRDGFLYRSIDERVTALEAGHLETRDILVKMVVHTNRISARVDGIETRLDRIETRMDGIETRMDGIETRMDRIEARMSTFATKGDLHDALHSQTWRMIGVVGSLVAVVYYVARHVH